MKNPALMTGSTLAGQLQRRLQEAKPGWDAQKAMAPEHPTARVLHHQVRDSSLRAGVLVLLYPKEDRWHLLLTQRTERVLHHRAQISFPGGQQEPGEPLPETALRETEEELGISPGAVRILGDLTPLYIPPSNYCIYPTVAVADSRPELRPAPQEVADVIEVPLSHLLDPANARKEVWTLRGNRVPVPYFFFRGHKIWGATAMVLAELVELVREVDPAGL